NGGNESERVIAPVTTGPSGQFRILGVEPGQYRISAERDGFIRQEYGQRNPGSKGVQISIVAGQQLTIDFQMLPAGVISGRILDEQGDPLAGATVQAQTYQYVNGKPILVGVPQFSPIAEGVVPPIRTTTNDRGEYRLFWLPPGEYYISVTARPEFSPDPTIDLSAQRLDKIITPAGMAAVMPPPNSPIFFPGVPNADTAAPIRVGPAAEIG